MKTIMKIILSCSQMIFVIYIQVIFFNVGDLWLQSCDCRYLVNFQKSLFPLTSVMTLTKFTARKYLNVDKVMSNGNYRYPESKKHINIAQIM